MSEQNDGLDKFRAKVLPMKEREKRPLSRREFIKAATMVGLGLGGAAGMWVSGKWLLEDLGVDLSEDENQLTTENFFEQESKILEEATHTSPTETTQPTEQAPEATAEPEPTETPQPINRWEWGDVTFEDGSEDIGMSYFFEDQQVLIPYFTPITWYEGILNTGRFHYTRNTGLVYEDDHQRKILNLHSGRRSSVDQDGFTAYRLQIFLEEYPGKGVRRYPREVNEIMKSIIGTEVVAKQGEKFAYSKIVAATRVDPIKVPESQQHVSDITSWLATNYPESGFQNLGPENNDIVVTKFCGRILNLEQEMIDQLEDKNLRDKINDTPPFQKARFFIAKKTTR